MSPTNSDETTPAGGLSADRIKEAIDIAIASLPPREPADYRRIRAGVHRHRASGTPFSSTSCARASWSG